ncbi:hypothetical protein D3C80_1001410 [compost metagenome]
MGEHTLAVGRSLFRAKERGVKSTFARHDASGAQVKYAFVCEANPVFHGRITRRAKERVSDKRSLDDFQMPTSRGNAHTVECDSRCNVFGANALGFDFADYTIRRHGVPHNSLALPRESGPGRDTPGSILRTSDNSTNQTFYSTRHVPAFLRNAFARRR